MNHRRSALLATVLALAALTGPAAANAQSPSPPAPVAPAVGDEGNEVVHSWALVPSGNDVEGGTGNRPDLSYVADPGSVIEDSVTLFNLSNVPLTFDVYATDAFNDDNGDFALLGSGEAPTGVGTWIGIGGRQVPVPARTQVTIPFTITIPESARPGDHAGAILAANAALSTGDDGQQITLDRRTGPRMFVRVNGPLVDDLAIADIETDHSSSFNPLTGATSVRYTIENRGNVRASATTRASVAGPFGLGEKRGLTKEIDDLLPGESVTVEEQFDGVPTLGVVVATVDLESSSTGAGSSDPVSRSATTFAPPVGVLLGLLALLFGWMTIRAIRRHRARTAESPEVVPAAEELRHPEHQPS